MNDKNIEIKLYRTVIKRDLWVLNLVCHTKGRCSSTVLKEMFGPERFQKTEGDWKRLEET